MTSSTIDLAFPDSAFPEWLAGLTFDRIPGHAIAAAKQALLDTLASGWAGIAADGVAPILDYVKSMGPGAATLWATEATVSLNPVAAALGNGLLAAALDFDIVQEKGTPHAHIVMVPALLALAEAIDCDGARFLTAYVGGCEMAVRLGLAAKTQPGWFYSSVFGVIAGAAACARLLDLGPDGIRAAIGIALSRASGSQQAMIEGCSTKRLQTAFAARDAVESAWLAQAGVRGPVNVFSGSAGFQALYTSLDANIPFVGLGDEWHFCAATYKFFPSCLCNHAAILAAQRAAGRRLRPEEIEQCTVKLPPFSARLVGAPFTPGSNPQTSAQFSVQYSVANALVRGGLTIADISVPAVLDASVIALAQRIKVEIDASATEWYTPATVEILLSDGSFKSVRVDSIPDATTGQRAAERRIEKARSCFTTGPSALTSEQFERLNHRISQLGEVVHMEDFWNL